MQPRKLSSALLLALGFSGAFSAQAAVTHLTFVEVNDIHANLVSHPDYQVGPKGAVKVKQLGGLAQTATLLNRIRGSNPNTLVFNIGDTYHGGVEATYTFGNAIVAPVNALGIDVGVAGNWDFTYGPSVSFLRFTNLTAAELTAAGLPVPPVTIARPAFPMLAANAIITLPGHAGESFSPPTMMKTMGDVQVGIIGLTSDIVASMNARLVTGMSFVQGEAAYVALINQHAASLREQGAKIVIVLSELGIHKSKRLGDVIATGAVDYIFSGHTHEAVFKPIETTSGALAMEAGNDSYVGRMDVMVKDGVIKKSKWHMIPVKAEIEENATVKGLVDAARAPFLADAVNMTVPNFPAQRLTQSIDTVVGSTQTTVNRRHALESNFNNAYAGMLRDFAGTQLAFGPGYRYDAIIDPENDTHTDGKITLEQLYRYFPQPFFLAKGEASGQQIRSMYEQRLTQTFSADVFLHSGGYYWGTSGLDAIVNLAAADGGRVQSLQFSDTGDALAAGGTYSVAACLRPGDPAGMLCATPGFTNVMPIMNPATSQPWTPVDMMVHTMAGGVMPSGAVRHITDSNNTAFWPEAPFIQPLEGVAP